MLALLPGTTRVPRWGPCASPVADAQMRDLFRDDPERASRFSLVLGDLLFDYSKNRITDETLSLLVQLADEEVDVDASPAVHLGRILAREDADAHDTTVRRGRRLVSGGAPWIHR